MTDPLEELKQQLYAKIQPQKSPSEIDHLKYSQLPQYQSHQRLRRQIQENLSDPLEDIRQEHEGFLSQLEGLAVEAIAKNDWTDFYAHLINFQNEHDLHGESGIVIGEERGDGYIQQNQD